MSLAMKAARALVLAVMVIVPLGLSVGQAGARPPIGVCPPPFQGPLTYQQVIDTWPPPAGVDPIPTLVFYDKNGDGTVCVMLLPHGAINVIDNAAMVP
jgi:hypothetical protein